MGMRPPHALNFNQFDEFTLYRNRKIHRERIREVSLTWIAVFSLTQINHHALLTLPLALSFKPSGLTGAQVCDKGEGQGSSFIYWPYGLLNLFIFIPFFLHSSPRITQVDKSRPTSFHKNAPCRATDYVRKQGEPRVLPSYPPCLSRWYILWICRGANWQV